MFDELDKIFEDDLFASHKKSLNQINKKKDIIKLKEGDRREVAILFADIKGFTALSEKLDHEYVQKILDKILKAFTICIQKYDGYIDKYEGDLVMALFGAKKASEHDTKKAIRAAIDMLKALNKFNILLTNIPELKEIKIELAVRIGINTGTVTTGKVGLEREGDFTVYGDAVNLASRMEANAPSNRIMIPLRTKNLVENSFNFDYNGEISVKGKEKPIRTYLVNSIKSNALQRRILKHSEYIGREKELNILKRTYNQSADNNCVKFIGVSAQAGLGKTRLIHEFIDSVKTGCNDMSSFDVLFGDTSAIIREPYRLFTSIFRRYFTISNGDNQQGISQKLDGGFKKIEDELNSDNNNGEARYNISDSLPLIKYMFSIPSDDDRLKAGENNVKESINMAIRDLLLTISTKIEQRLNKPLIIVLDDLHWLDNSSAHTLQYLIDNYINNNESIINSHKLLIIALYRPEYNISNLFANENAYDEIRLLPLNQNNSVTLIESMIGKILLPPKIKDLLLQKSQGNPFYIEEWVKLIKDLNFLEHTDETKNLVNNTANLPIPENLKTLILARIDNFDKNIKLLLQKASIIGKKFPKSLLTEIENRHDLDTTNIDSDLAILVNNTTIEHSAETGSTSDIYYLFHHVLTHDAAYGTLLLQNRKVLHKLTAEIIEERYSDNLTELYFELADHYEKAEVNLKAKEYIFKAAEKALKMFDYDTSLKLLGKFRKYKLTTKELADSQFKEIEIYKILERRKEGFDLCDKIKATYNNDDYYYQKAVNLKAELFRKESRFLEAISEVNSIKDFCNHEMEIEGRIHQGYAYILTGKIEKAEQVYKFLKNNYQHIENKLLLTECYKLCGYLHNHKRDLLQGMEYYQKAYLTAKNNKLVIQELQSLQNIGVSHAKMGKYDDANNYFTDVYKKARKINNIEMTLLCVNNISKIYYLKKEFATAEKFISSGLKYAMKLNKDELKELFWKNLANIRLDQKKYNEVIELCQKREKIALYRNNLKHLCQINDIKGDAYFMLDNYEKALKIYSENLALATKIKNNSVVGHSYGNIANCYDELGDMDNCLRFYEKQLDYAKNFKDRQSEAKALHNLAYTFFNRFNDLKKGSDYCRQALVIYQEIGYKHGLEGAEKLLNKYEQKEPVV